MWIEQPFKSVLGGTALMFIVVGALYLGISAVGAFV